MRRTPNHAPMVWRFGVVGTNGIGKTTFIEKLAAHIRKIVPETVLVLTPNFADPLRNTLERAWPQDLTAQKVHPLERETLQATGEMWRHYNRTIWVELSQQDMSNEIAMQEYEKEPLEFEQAILLYSDVYHLNEALTMDQIMFVDQVDENYLSMYELALMADYIPVSRLQTLYMLAHHEDQFGDLLNAADIDYLTVNPYSSVYSISDSNNLDFIRSEILMGINIRRVEGLGLKPLGVSEMLGESE